MIHNDILEELVSRYMDLHDQGETQSLEEICREHPEYVPSLRERLALLAWGDRLVSSTEATSHAMSESESKLDYSFFRPAEQPDEIGRLHGFRILRLLGSGGMGYVFAAEDLLAQRIVAMKVMRTEYLKSSWAKEQFLQEMRAAAALEHDHVVSLLQVGEDHGVLFLTMPLLKGLSLAELLNRGQQLPLSIQLKIAREIAEALHAAHAQGFIHSDIKPANLWLEPRTQIISENSSELPKENDFAFILAGHFRVKILDFGLARNSAIDLAHEQARLMGTLGYISPEQLKNEPIDARSDLFSYGCVLYELATGRRAYLATDSITLLQAMKHSRSIPPSQINHRIPAVYSDLIQRLLSPNRIDRPTSALEVLGALGKIDLQSPPTRTSSTLQKILATSIAIVLTAGIIIAGVMLRRGDDKFKHLSNPANSNIINNDPYAQKDLNPLLYVTDFREAHGLDLDELRVWFAALPSGFRPSELTSCGESTPPRFDTIAIRDNLNIPFKASLDLDRTGPQHMVDFSKVSAQGYALRFVCTYNSGMAFPRHHIWLRDNQSWFVYGQESQSLTEKIELWKRESMTVARFYLNGPDPGRGNPKRPIAINLRSSTQLEFETFQELTLSELVEKMKIAKQQSRRPDVLSAIGAGDNRSFVLTLVPNPIGLTWDFKAELTAKQYENAIREQQKLKRRPMFVMSNSNGDEVRYTAVWVEYSPL